MQKMSKNNEPLLRDLTGQGQTAYNQSDYTARVGLRKPATFADALDRATRLEKRIIRNTAWQVDLAPELVEKVDWTLPGGGAR